MARARLIKPRFFTNDTLAEISPLGRLLFIALWTIADREGRLEYRPKRIKVDCLPYDNCDVIELITQLQKLGFLSMYEVEKNQYIQITNFTKHQNPHAREQASEIPCPEQGTTKAVTSNSLGDDEPGLNPLTLTLNPIPEDGLSDDKKSGPTADRTNRKRPVAEFTPPDWVPRKDWDDWLEMRRAIKSPPTFRAMEIAVEDLKKYKAAGSDPGAVLQQSIANNWKGLFATKGKSTYSQPIEIRTDGSRPSHRPAGNVF